MHSFSGTTVMCCVDHEIWSINMVTLNNCFKQLRVVDYSLLHEVDNLILNVTTQILKVVHLHTQFIFKLSLLSQKVSIIPVIIILQILTQWVLDITLIQYWSCTPQRSSRFYLLLMWLSECVRLFHLSVGTFYEPCRKAVLTTIFLESTGNEEGKRKHCWSTKLPRRDYWTTSRLRQGSLTRKRCKGTWSIPHSISKDHRSTYGFI